MKILFYIPTFLLFVAVPTIASSAWKTLPASPKSMMEKKKGGEKQLGWAQRALRCLGFNRAAVVSASASTMIVAKDKKPDDFNPVAFFNEQFPRPIQGIILEYAKGIDITSPIKEFNHGACVFSVASLPNGNIASGGSDSRVNVWNPSANSSTPIRTFLHGGRIYSVASLQNGTIASGGHNGVVHVWNPDAPGDEPTRTFMHGAAVFSVASLQGGKVASGGRGGYVRIWSLSGSDNKAEKEFDRNVKSTVLALASSHNGEVASAGTDELVIVRSGPDHKVIKEYHHGSCVSSLASLSDGTFASGGVDGLVNVWDPRTAGSKPTETLTHGRGQVHGIAYFLDGTFVSAGQAGLIYVWDKRSSEPTRTATHGDHVWSLACLPNGTIVSGGSDGLVNVWDKEIENSFEKALKAESQSSSASVVTHASAAKKTI